MVAAKRLACQEWDSNPRLQGRLRPERSALDRSAILTAVVGAWPLAWLQQPAVAQAGGGASAAAVWLRNGAAARANARAEREQGQPGGLGPRPRPPGLYGRLVRPPPGPRRLWDTLGPLCPGAMAPLRGNRQRRTQAFGVCRVPLRVRGRVGSPSVQAWWSAAAAAAAAAGERSGSPVAVAVLVSIVVSIPACHAGDRGSIPRRGGRRPFWPLPPPARRGCPAQPFASCPVLPFALHRGARRHPLPGLPTGRPGRPLPPPPLPILRAKAPRSPARHSNLLWSPQRMMSGPVSNVCLLPPSDCDSAGARAGGRQALRDQPR